MFLISIQHIERFYCRLYSQDAILGSLCWHCFQVKGGRGGWFYTAKRSSMSRRYISSIKLMSGTCQSLPCIVVTSTPQWMTNFEATSWMSSQRGHLKMVLLTTLEIVFSKIWLVLGRNQAASVGRRAVDQVVAWRTCSVSYRWGQESLLKGSRPGGRAWQTIQLPWKIGTK